MDPQQALEVLGVARADGRTAALRAYRAGIRAHRPERDPAGFRRVREAWEALEQLPLAWWTADEAPAAGAAEVEEGPLDEPPRAVDPPLADDDVVRQLPELDVGGERALRKATDAALRAWDLRGGADGPQALLEAFQAWQGAPAAFAVVDWSALLHANLAPNLPLAQRLELIDAAVAWVRGGAVRDTDLGRLHGVAVRAEALRPLWGKVDPTIEHALHAWVWDVDARRLQEVVAEVAVQRPASHRRACDLVASHAPFLRGLFVRAQEQAGTHARQTRETPASESAPGWVWLWVMCMVISALARGIGAMDVPPPPVTEVAERELRVGAVCGLASVHGSRCEALIDVVNAARLGACEPSKRWMLESWRDAEGMRAPELSRAMDDLMSDLDFFCGRARHPGRATAPEDVARALERLCSGLGDLRVCEDALRLVGQAGTGLCEAAWASVGRLNDGSSEDDRPSVQAVVRYDERACGPRLPEWSTP